MSISEKGRVRAAMEASAEIIGCDLAAIEAVFEVEASGRFFNNDGSPIRRFEPHHFPKQHWDTLGFQPAPGQSPWRAAYKIKTSVRASMFDHAVSIDKEAAHRAASFGAPQIMGFNHEEAGYASAIEMRRQFDDDYEQVMGFTRLVTAWGLDSAVRAHDWRTFAARYNGNGQADVYAAKIASAYKHHSGGRSSAKVLRLGSQGEAVERLQTALMHVGRLKEGAADGFFGRKTEEALKEFQAGEGLKIDGVAGAMTWAALKAPKRGVPATVEPVAHATEGEKLTITTVLEGAKTLGGLGVGSGLMAFWEKLPELAQIVVIGAGSVGACGVLGVGAYVYMSDRMRAARGKI